MRTQAWSATLLAVFVSAPSAALAQAPAADNMVEDGFYVVNQPERVDRIAAQLLVGRSYTAPQMIWALARCNPAVFDSGAEVVASGVRLRIPRNPEISGTSPGEARARLAHGLKPLPDEIFPAPGEVTTVQTTAVAPQPTVQASEPAPAPSAVASAAPVAAPAEPAPSGAPTITGVELKRPVRNHVHQALVVLGRGFQPGARLEFVDLAQHQSLPPRTPEQIAGDRIDYAVRFTSGNARWQVSVLNPDGQHSAAFEFDGGRDAGE